MGNEKRKKYNPSNPRLPGFYKQFRELTDNVGGVTKVSELTGISRPTVQFWYNGERTPDAENLCKLSRVFGVSVDYLLGLAEKNNSTNDEKLRMVSEYTGLSNAAIKNIRNLRFFNPDAFAALNHFTESRSFWEVITESISLAVYSLHIHKKHRTDDAKNKAERITRIQNSIALTDAEDVANIFLDDGSFFNAPKGTVLLSADVASDYYKSKVVKAFSYFLDKYVDTKSDEYLGKDEE